MRADAALLLALPATLIAVELVFRLRFRQVLGTWLGVMRTSASLMGDKSLSDDEKQARMAKASVATLGGSLKLFAIIVLALAGFVLTISAGVALFRLDTSLPETIIRSDLHIASVITAILYIWIRRRVFG